MLDLDQYIDRAIEVGILGKHIHVRQPGIRIYRLINELEADLNHENLPEKRLETAVLLLGNNREGVTFTSDELSVLSVDAIDALIAEIANMKIKADSDPNLRSPSRKGK